MFKGNGRLARRTAPAWQAGRHLRGAVAAATPPPQIPHLPSAHKNPGSIVFAGRPILSRRVWAYHVAAPAQCAKVAARKVLAQGQNLQKVQEKRAVHGGVASGRPGH